MKSTFEQQRMKLFTSHPVSTRPLAWSPLIPLLLSLIGLVPIHECFFIDQRSSPKTHQWNYNDQLDWGQAYRQCRGRSQSPVDIQRRYVIENNQLKLHFYNYDRPTKFRLQNAHHTIKMNPFDNRPPAGFREDVNSSLPDLMTAVEETDSTASAGILGKSVLTGGEPGRQTLPYDGNPSIKLDWLDDGNNEFKLHDIHLHWGERRDNGSEHAIDGRRAAMEMHLVHIKHGIDKSKISFVSDSVAVIAILIESYRRSNVDFNPIVNALGRINMTHQPETIEYKSINDLLPSSLTSFYTYSGSLTTPPCHEVVNWIVVSDRVYLNAKQIEMFRNLYSPTDEEDSHAADPTLIMPNVRHIQTLGQRTIMASFPALARHERPATQGPTASVAPTRPATQEPPPLTTIATVAGPNQSLYTGSGTSMLSPLAFQQVMHFLLIPLILVSALAASGSCSN